VQDQWAKIMVPVLDWVLVSGLDAITVVERMEKRSSGKVVYVPPSTFKTMESVFCPEDYREITTDLLKDTVHVTASLVRDVISRVVRRRYWSWLLLHPQLSDKDIHTSRRVFPDCFSCD
jgi:hypothetical protein